MADRLEDSCHRPGGDWKAWARAQQRRTDPFEMVLTFGHALDGSIVLGTLYIFSHLIFTPTLRS